MSNDTFRRLRVVLDPPTAEEIAATAARMKQARLISIKEAKEKLARDEVSRATTVEGFNERKAKKLLGPIPHTPNVPDCNCLECYQKRRDAYFAKKTAQNWPHVYECGSCHKILYMNRALTTSLDFLCRGMKDGDVCPGYYVERPRVVIS